VDHLKDTTMIPPTDREIQAAIRVLDLLRQSIDDADAEEGRKRAPESSEELERLGH